VGACQGCFGRASPTRSRGRAFQLALRRGSTRGSLDRDTCRRGWTSGAARIAPHLLLLVDGSCTRQRWPGDRRPQRQSCDAVGHAVRVRAHAARWKTGNNLPHRVAAPGLRRSEPGPSTRPAPEFRR
jgi:hypothetical protein